MGLESSDSRKAKGVFKGDRLSDECGRSGFAAPGANAKMEGNLPDEQNFHQSYTDIAAEMPEVAEQKAAQTASESAGRTRFQQEVAEQKAAQTHGHQKKAWIIFGTRPELIKLAPVIRCM
jgi:hypothetical protein